MIEAELPPPVLYNYSSVGSWLPACLAGKSLKFSSRTDFNDPFDSRPAYHIDTGVDGQRYIHDKLKAASGLSPAKRLLLQQRVRNQTRTPRQFGELITDEILDNVGILCLTEEWDEPLFWGHYAAKHTGICIGFRTDRDVFRLANEITYQDELPIIMRPQDSNDDMVRKAFLTKSIAWKHEKEWRIIKHKTPDSIQAEQRRLMKTTYLDQDDARIIADQRGANIYEFDPTSVESLTMGMFISPANEKLVIESIKSADINVHLYKATRHPTRYKIGRDLVRIYKAEAR